MDAIASLDIRESASNGSTSFLRKPLAELIPPYVRGSIDRALSKPDSPIRQFMIFRIHPAPPIPWSWFDHSEDADAVYLYRGVGPDTAEYPSLAHAVAAQDPERTLAVSYWEHGETRLDRLVGQAFFGAEAPSVVLHTSYARDKALGYVERSGRLVRFKVPKAYIEAYSGRFLYNEYLPLEKEIGVLFGLPEEFVDGVEPIVRFAPRADKTSLC